MQKQDYIPDFSHVSTVGGDIFLARGEVSILDILG